MVTGDGREHGEVVGLRAGPEVDVIGPDDVASEPADGVGVLVGQATARQDGDGAGTVGVDGRGQLLRGGVDGGDPRGALQRTGAAADQGGVQPVGVGHERVAVAVLVVQPRLVDGEVGPGERALDDATAHVVADVGARRVVEGDAGDPTDVERPGAEAVAVGRQGADRADLDDVAGEVGLVGLVAVDRDLLQRTALEQLDERVTGDLLGEAGAASAQHAGFAVEGDLGVDRQSLGEDALLLVHARFARPVLEGLVLQGALATLVALRAVQGVVDQQELQLGLLVLPGHLGGLLGADDHVGADGLGARGHRLAGPLDVDEALTARGDGVQQRVVAEPRDGDADLLGSTDHQGPGLDLEGMAVDGDRDQLALGLGGIRHARLPPSSRDDRSGRCR